MKSLNTKVLAALAVVAMLTSPALAQKQRHVARVHDQSAQSAASSGIPGYDRDGGVVQIPDPDQR